MEHVKRASREGWRTLAVVAVVIPVMGLAPWFFEIGIVWTVLWISLLLFVSGIAISYAVFNIRSGGVFRCRLTEEKFSQTIPVPSCGESFEIMLSDIIRIEIHEGIGDGPSDQWFLHTLEGGFQITTNYGNPHRKFGEAIQHALPHLETITI